MKLHPVMLPLTLVLSFPAASTAQCDPDFLADLGTAPVGDRARAITAADFDGDGNPDLAVANDGDDTVSVLLGLGDGTFAPATHYPAGDGPVSIVAADLNGDGVPDLATANVYSDNVTVLLGAGGGSFGAPLAAAAGDGATAIAAADLDGDGIPDLATANSFADTISILTGAGDGSFTADHLQLTAGSFPNDVALADVTGDGRMELVMSLRSDADPRVLVALFDEAGDWVDTRYLTLSDRPVSLDLADLDGDGVLDIAVTSYQGSTIRIAIGTGAGSFHPAEFSFFLPGGLYDMTVADLDRDGHPDIAAADLDADRVWLCLNGTESVTITEHPASRTFSSGENVTLTVTAANAVGYLWRRDGVPLADGGPYSGVHTNQLTVAGASESQQGHYDVLVSAECHAGKASRPAALLLCDDAPDCAADFNGDGVIDTRDVLAFLSAWNAGC